MFSLAGLRRRRRWTQVTIIIVWLAWCVFVVCEKTKRKNQTTAEKNTKMCENICLFGVLFVCLVEKMCESLFSLFVRLTGVVCVFVLHCVVCEENENENDKKHQITAENKHRKCVRVCFILFHWCCVWICVCVTGGGQLCTRCRCFGRTRPYRECPLPPKQETLYLNRTHLTVGVRMALRS